MRINREAIIDVVVIGSAIVFYAAFALSVLVGVFTFIALEVAR